MTDWPKVHERVLAAFSAGWEKPGPHAWDDLLDADLELIQPMLRDGRGREVWWDEVSRLMALLPDLRGDVVRWSGTEDTVFIHVRFSGTLGGKPLEWRAVDELRVDPAGSVLRRESFFDSTPLALQVLLRPRAWLPWWRSGIAPLSDRRRMQGSRPCPAR